MLYGANLALPLVLRFVCVQGYMSVEMRENTVEQWEGLPRLSGDI